MLAVSHFKIAQELTGSLVDRIQEGKEVVELEDEADLLQPQSPQVAPKPRE
jgi:hypothetical protein